MPVTLGAARLEEMTTVLRLLEANGLPTAGLSDHWSTTTVAREAERIVGSAALEVYPDGALLRSVAVEPSMHGRGLGHDLVAAALDMARARGVKAVYLLTTTAGAFFPRFGFSRIMRAEVPTYVQKSVEFTSACPSSAVVMRKVLVETTRRSDDLEETHAKSTQ
jgi:amino-acid N-acetyltransferase